MTKNTLNKYTAGLMHVEQNSEVSDQFTSSAVPADRYATNCYQDMRIFGDLMDESGAAKQSDAGAIKQSVNGPKRSRSPHTKLNTSDTKDTSFGFPPGIPARGSEENRDKTI